MTIQKVRSGVQLRLREWRLGRRTLSRVLPPEMSTTTTRPSGKSHIRAWSEHGLAHRWRYDDSQAVRDFR